MERTRALIVTAFKAWFDALSPPQALRLVYDNLPGVKPSGEPWARVSVQQGNNWLPFIGQRKRKRCVGMLSVQIFLPEESGVKVATEFSQLMGDHFDDTELAATTGGGVQTQVLFRTTSLLLITAEDGYQQYNAALEFQRDTIHP